MRKESWRVSGDMVLQPADGFSAKIKEPIPFATQAYRVMRREAKGCSDAEIRKKTPPDGEAV